ncbi:MAG: FAD:protein FMN transferase [Rhodomicrobium sp.]
MEQTADSVRRARPLLGTFVEICAKGEALTELEAAVEDAFTAIAKVHRLMSFQEHDSDVSRLNREAHARPVKVDPWTYRVLEAALDFDRQSEGLFDIAVAPALQKIGLLPDITAMPTPLSAHPANKGMRGEPLTLLQDRSVRFHGSGTRIDLSGIAKGFAVDRAVEVLKNHGVLTGLVNAGGDLAVFGTTPHPIHIRDPGNPRRLLCNVALCNEAFASSGPSFDPLTFHAAHASAIIHPATQRQVCTGEGVTVRASSCVTADALTKIVMIAGPESTDLLDHYGASALIVSPGGGIRSSPNWKGALKIAA